MAADGFTEHLRYFDAVRESALQDGLTDEQWRMIIAGDADRSSMTLNSAGILRAALGGGGGRSDQRAPGVSGVVRLYEAP
jgi:hypothetical protein